MALLLYYGQLTLTDIDRTNRHRAIPAAHKILHTHNTLQALHVGNLTFKETKGKIALLNKVHDNATTIFYIYKLIIDIDISEPAEATINAFSIRRVKTPHIYIYTNIENRDKHVPIFAATKQQD